MADKPDTKTLLEEARGGDRAAFEVVASECRGRLEGFVKTRLGSHLRSIVEVEDVIQETFAEAIASISRFEWRGDDSFLRWLNRIAEHAILNNGRHDPEVVSFPKSFSIVETSFSVSSITRAVAIVTLLM